MENIFDRIEIHRHELNEYFNKKIPTKELAEALLEYQILTWEKCAINYQNLAKVEVRNIEFDDFTIKIQYNPARIISSSAKVDKKSIEQRKCFLCPENIPEEQRGFNVGGYFFLVNPFPIFPQHFTIPSLKHEPQLIYNHFDTMLYLCKKFKNLTFFYNGPKCGASAPDHFHFQAGNKGFLPIENDFEKLCKKNKEVLIENNQIKILALNDYLRKFIALEADNMLVLHEQLKSVYTIISDFWKHDDEPMFNILASRQKDFFRILIFLRKAHRPKQYFAEDNEKILLSPASVDFGGVCITPREEDFRKIRKEDTIDIFKQVSVDDNVFNQITSKLRNYYRNK